MSPRNPAADVRDLVDLDPDHPGFKDAGYRARRDTIARIALSHEPGAPVPDAPYTDEEHAVWRSILQLLRPVHEAHVCRELLAMQRTFPLPRYRIPQLAFVNRRLTRRSGMRLEPVMGLVQVRTFLSFLSADTFLSTQYIRHHSRPLYTPEPDVVHELIGHAASLAHPALADANRWMGRAAVAANDRELRRLEHVYWYVLEFGLVEQEGALKAVGAGLLSSAGECAGIEHGPELRGWDLDAIAETPYDPTRMQPHLFVAPSFDRMLSDLEDWVRRGAWRDKPAALAHPPAMVYQSSP